jgi:predicted RNA-binding protein Jag
MKSLVEEASTIGKAIEAAWDRAGKPQSFSIKVFEQPEYGFLGMTKKYAKISIFFEESSPKEGATKKHYNASQDQSKYAKKMPFEDKNGVHVSGVKQKKEEQTQVHRGGVPAKKADTKTGSAERKEIVPLKKRELVKNAESSYVWTEGMVKFLNDFVSHTIACMGKADVSFEFKQEQANLKLIFHGLLVQQQSREASFYKNLAHLMVTALRTKFKTEFKHLRLVLSRE